MVIRLFIFNVVNASTTSFNGSSVIHPWLDSGRVVQIDCLVDAFRCIAPVYAALHFIPMILFKRYELMRKPLPMLLRAFRGAMRNSAFLSVLVTIYQCKCLSYLYLFDLFSIALGTTSWVTFILQPPFVRKPNYTSRGSRNICRHPFANH